MAPLLTVGLSSLDNCCIVYFVCWFVLCCGGMPTWVKWTLDLMSMTGGRTYHGQHWKWLGFMKPNSLLICWLAHNSNAITDCRFVFFGISYNCCIVYLVCWFLLCQGGMLTYVKWILDLLSMTGGRIYQVPLFILFVNPDRLLICWLAHKSLPLLTVGLSSLV